MALVASWRSVLSLRNLSSSKNTLSSEAINLLRSRNLLKRQAPSWAQFVSLRRKYATETVSGSAVAVSDEKKGSIDGGEKVLRLSDSCVKVKLVFYSNMYLLMIEGPPDAQKCAYLHVLVNAPSRVLYGNYWVRGSSRRSCSRVLHDLRELSRTQ